MASEDCGSQLVTAWHAKSFLVDLGLMVCNGVPYTGLVNTHDRSLQDIFKQHGDGAMLTASCLLHDESLRKKEKFRVLTDGVVHLRKEHGFRIKEDRRNEDDPTNSATKDAAVINRAYHVGRSTWQWLSQAYYEPWFASNKRLLELEVIHYRNDRLVLDREMHQLRELHSRALLAQRTKSQILWIGGIYGCCRLLADDPAEVQDHVNRCRRLCTRLCATEEFAASEAAIPSVIQFLEGYIWGASQPYRFVLTLIVDGELQLAQEFLEQFNKSVRHEKGIEDLLGSVRRLVRHGSVNKRACINRMYTCVRRAVEHTFPNVKQERVDRVDWDNPSNFEHSILQDIVPGIKFDAGPRLVKDEFRPKVQKELPGPKPGHRTLAAPDHSGQACFSLPYCFYVRVL